MLSYYLLTFPFFGDGFVVLVSLCSGGFVSLKRFDLFLREVNSLSNSIQSILSDSHRSVII